MQEEVKWRQQMLSQNDKLLQSLRVELKVYEQLEEERRKQPGTRRSAQGPCREAGSPGQGRAAHFFLRHCHPGRSWWAMKSPLPKMERGKWEDSGVGQLRTGCPLGPAGHRTLGCGNRVCSQPSCGVLVKVRGGH